MIQSAKSMKPIEVQASYHHDLPGLLRHESNLHIHIHHIGQRNPERV